jgi:preprotein translocase subunit SecE
MNILQSIQDYFRGALGEMKKVSWPSKKQITNYSIIVIIMSIGVAVFFGVLDYIFNFGLDQIIK